MSDLVFKGNPKFETERLILRKLMPSDADDIFAYATDDEVTKYTTWDTHNTIDQAKAFIKFTLDRNEKDEAADWGIILKETGRLIGAMGLYKYNKNDSCVELGYVLARPFWGKALMPEAVNRVLKFAFEEMKINRVECYHFFPNEKSGRVMQKVGMTFEGIIREKIFAKGIFCDVKQYAILKKDWEENGEYTPPVTA